MKKMTVLVSVENVSSAEKVFKLAKQKLGLKKGERVLRNGDTRVLFSSGIIQRNFEKVEELAKFKSYDMLIIPSFGEGVSASPKIQGIKMHVNNVLGFSVFVVAVPPKPSEKEAEDAAENLCDIIRANVGL